MSWALLILILLLAMPTLAGVTLLLLFLVSPKGRPWRSVLMWLGGLSLILLVGLWWLRGSMHPSMSASISRPVNTNGSRAGGYDREYGQTIKEVVDYRNGVSYRKETKVVAAPASAETSPGGTAKKVEADPSAILAARAAGVIEVIGRALGRALSEEKEPPVAKKTEAKPAPVAPPVNAPPDWVHKRPQMVGDSYQVSIVVGPWKTRQECEAELPKKLQRALDDYTDACQPDARHVVLPAKYLRSHLVKEMWEEDIESETASIGTMKQLHVLLQFDNEVKNLVAEQNHRAVVAGRLWKAGFISAAVFWFLGVFYGYLRIDMATGGIYRGRLRFAAGLAILGPLAAVLAVVS